MHKWIAVVLLSVTLRGGTLVADETPTPLKEGDVVNLELIGDAARAYARINRLSLDKAASPVPVLSMHTVLYRVDNESGINIEHEYESTIDGERYLCILTGTVPTNAIERVPVLDLRTPATPGDTTERAPKPLGYTTRLRITDFQIFPKLKLQRWKMVSELDGDDTHGIEPADGG